MTHETEYLVTVFRGMDDWQQNKTFNVISACDADDVRRVVRDAVRCGAKTSEISVYRKVAASVSTSVDVDLP